MTNKRSRTGCATCRSRKLKCDEVKPICGHCQKSNRPCVASDGVAFRHEQNPSINAMAGDRKLKNFFDYREVYTEEHIKSFLPTQPIAEKLQWIVIDNPYDEDQNPSNPGLGASSYQQVASHSLEALSEAATDQPTYPQPTYEYDTHHFIGRSKSRTGYGPAIQGQNHQNNDINFLLNPSNTPANMIDPNLEATAVEELAQQAEEKLEEAIQPEEHDIEKALDTKEIDQESQSEEQVAFLLRNYTPASELETGTGS